MGVIQRFAVSSMVLGVLAMAGGASAIAFESGGESPAVQPAGQPAPSSDVSSDVPADNASDVLPETGGSDASWNWFTPRGR